jgi:hypothetical protein
MNLQKEKAHTRDSESAPPLKVYAALYKHGRKDVFAQGRTLHRFGDREWRVANRQVRLSPKHRHAFLITDGRGEPVRSGYHATPFLAFYLEAAAAAMAARAKEQCDGI